MAYWLFKSEPSGWSWDNQVERGDAGEEWTGVRNYQARNQMRQMKVGDLGFFYHTETAREIVGIVEVIAEAHPDSTADDARWECVDIKAVRALPRAISLIEIKANPRLADMALAKQPRLSVQPVSDDEWQIVLDMADNHT